MDKDTLYFLRRILESLDRINPDEQLLDDLSMSHAKFSDLSEKAIEKLIEAEENACN